ncbi:hypothetical protein M0657_005362 [Pyricularia oryzae]|uniref:Uncharacterized protein n=1 Tax=Pyricularia oryzae TaxID=318829 RepID=A0A4P7NAF5_PYROR|nr:hypothetical protein M0657_005362 [Pyricularia oryzae]KAI7925489.1 hypothetical protein M9X92_003263 [Pyricularia oryzae]QBZ57150.1 hypothetical protein PoMZ_02074 [Pyricularia oryzae]
MLCCTYSTPQVADWVRGMYGCRKALVNFMVTYPCVPQVDNDSSFQPIRHVSCWFREVGGRCHEIIPLLCFFFFAWMGCAMVAHTTVPGNFLTSRHHPLPRLLSLSDICECCMGVTKLTDLTPASAPDLPTCIVI